MKSDISKILLKCHPSISYHTLLYFLPHYIMAYQFTSLSQLDYKERFLILFKSDTSVNQ